MNLKRMVLRTGAAMAMMMAVQTPAFAETADLGLLGPNETKGVIFSHTPGGFTDTVLFSIGTPGAGQADYFNFLVTAGKVRSNIANAMLVLSGPSNFSTSLTNGTSYALTLLSGSYTATITGNATGVNGGAYNLDITAPTPEPATVGLMLLGMAMAGYVATRRRRATGEPADGQFSFA